MAKIKRGIGALLKLCAPSTTTHFALRITHFQQKEISHMAPTVITFVCHGNICRSPMAEFIMKYVVQQAGLETQFSITSVAATTEEIGHDMYPPAKRMLAKKGIPFTPRKARLFTDVDYAKSDYIIAMDEENLDDLAYLTHGDPDKKVSLLLDWAGEHREVADPWYTGNFERTYQDVLQGCQALLKAVTNS